MTYSNHPTPVTSTTLTTSQRLAEQTLSLLCMCMLVCFAHLTMLMQGVLVHALSLSTVYMYLCFCTSSKLYSFVTHHLLHCSWENYSPTETFMCQSAACQTKKALEGTITECECNSFHLFWQFVSQGNDEALIGRAREWMKPHS